MSHMTHSINHFLIIMFDSWLNLFLGKPNLLWGWLSLLLGKSDCLLPPGLCEWQKDVLWGDMQLLSLIVFFSTLLTIMPWASGGEQTRNLLPGLTSTDFCSIHAQHLNGMSPLWIHDSPLLCRQYNPCLLWTLRIPHTLCFLKQDDFGLTLLDLVLPVSFL